MHRARLAGLQLRGIDELGALHPDDRAGVRKGLEQTIKAAAPWEHKIEPGVIEGTGMVWPWIGNVEEVYGQTDRGELYQRKMTAAMAHARALKTAAPETPLGVVAEFLKLEKQPYEAWARKDQGQWRDGPLRGTTPLLTFYRFLPSPGPPPISTLLP